ncbi:uncharacterized protein CLUP02_10148 [Colletotrichum lupini]|uniref:Uncharacterized protein n=1 Tax=Colletotrichum lupini TaxID=145971 RepID=A0A9Q8WJ36_9PEZI|nr:uncharacterized protein CLUP02_10148 [Colletotrichum lupini]UQC84652.1 hypothetical protein CLUP02_10148 [Colletotrichum lupini]
MRPSMQFSRGERKVESCSSQLPIHRMKERMPRDVRNPKTLKDAVRCVNGDRPSALDWLIGIGGEAEHRPEIPSDNFGAETACGCLSFAGDYPAFWRYYRGLLPCR